MAKTKTLNLLIRQDSMYIVQSVTNSLAPKPGEVLDDRRAQEYVNDPRWKVNVKQLTNAEKQGVK